MCVSYCALNKLVIKNQVPLHNIDDVWGQMRVAKYYLTTDLKSAQHQAILKTQEYVSQLSEPVMDRLTIFSLHFGLGAAPGVLKH